uniref:Uncharacterized protein n=1 Tax=Spongospora subterranea TaxID=70186 RepID=A0A0H5R3K7_9EUKA|eukprot:CRZ02604.1 hypothetical protein [Spongospora subterranea]
MTSRRNPRHVNPSATSIPTAIPGFRFDPVLNRYFAIDRNNRSSVQPTPTPSSNPNMVNDQVVRERPSLFKMTQRRNTHCLKEQYFMRNGCNARSAMMKCFQERSSLISTMPGNQAIAYWNNVIVSCGSSTTGAGVSELNSVNARQSPFSIDPLSYNESIVAAKSTSLFSSLSIRNGYACYSTLGSTQGGSVSVQNVLHPDVALNFSFPRKRYLRMRFCIAM